MTDSSVRNIFALDQWYSEPPAFYHLNFNRIARAKAQNQEECIDSVSEKFCNGTEFLTYINWWVNEAVTITIRTSVLLTGTKMTRPFHVVATSICDGTFYHQKGGTNSPSLGECPRETGNEDRRYSFSEYGRQMGIGFAGYGTPQHAEYNDSTYFLMLTDTTTNFYIDKYIASGAHLINPFNEKEFVFKVNYASEEEPAKARLVYGEQVIGLDIEYQDMGGIVYTSANMTDIPDECVPYYFQFEHDGEIEYYPERGKFMTYGLGSCTIDYVGEDCTEGECCVVEMGLYRPATKLCREGTGCFASTYCNGYKAECPEQGLKPPGSICRKADKPCEEDSYCTGKSGVCPGIQYKAAGTVCIEEKSPCQDNSYCDGKTGECKAVFKSNNTLCESSNTDCVKDHFCTGTSNTCNKTVVFQPGGELCSFGKCSGFDASCSRKIGTVTVNFRMDNDVSTEGLADGIIEGILGGNTDGLLRIKKTNETKGISVTVELTNSTLARVLYDGLRLYRKLGKHGAVKNIYVTDMFETVSMPSLGIRAEVSMLRGALFALILTFLFML